MTTAADLINGGLRLIGQLAEDETPSVATANDALVAFDQMIDSWSTERLAVFTTMDQVKTWPAGAATRTLGPSGSLTGLRPISMDAATYFKQGSLSFGIQLVNEQQYNAIALKSVTSTYPEVMYVSMDYPNVTLSVYPVPTQDLEFHFVSVQELAQPAALATALLFPPGYLRAFRYNLACEIAAEFGIEPPRQVVRIAVTAKRNLKRINNPGDILAMPYALVGPVGRFNIYSGSFG